MACFNDIVAIDGTCTLPSSGLFLNDVGINLDHLNAIVERDYESGEALGNDKIAFAGKLVSNLVLGRFNDKFKTTSLVDGGRIGRADDNIAIDGLTANYKGIELEVCNNDSFLDLCLNTITLHVNFTGDVEVKVFDLKQGKEIDSITVAAVSGSAVDVDINKIYSSDRRPKHIFIGYDATAIDAVRYSVGSGSCGNCSRSCYPVNSFLKVGGATLDLAAQPIQSNLKGFGFTGGLSFNYSISCNHELWLCSMKNLIGLPILYKAASLISQYALESSRSNSDTLIDSDKWTMRMDKSEMLFRESLDNIIHSIKLPNDTKCFSCNSPVKYAVNLP
jgi:hypothetical protein